MNPLRWRACLDAGVVVVLAMAAFTACGGGGPVAVAEAAGCTDVLTDYQDLETRSIVSISADECHKVAADGSRVLLSASAAQDLLAYAVWTARAPQFDGVYASVYRAVEEPRFRFSQSREIGRDELVTRWGPRPERLDTASPWRDADKLLWLLLLALWVAIPIVFIRIARATRPAEYLIIRIR